MAATMVAAGHQRFEAATLGQAPNRLKDPQRPDRLAWKLGISTDTRSDKEIAVDVGRIALGESGKSEGYQLMTKRAPVPRQQLWQQRELVPRAIDREVAESFHRNTLDVDQDCCTLVLHTSRISLADGWGGAILTTELN